MPGGLDAEKVARLIARHGSLDAASEGAQLDPRFRDALRVVAAKHALSAGREAHEVADEEWWQLVVAWSALTEAEAASKSEAKPRWRAGN